MTAPTMALKNVLALHWRPNKDLLAIAISCVLVTASLYTATFVVGSTSGGGFLYFLVYAGLTAALFGVGLPLYWTVAVRRRPLSDLGLTTKRLGLSMALQLVFTVVQFAATLGRSGLPPFEQLLPLVALALTIGFFEAVFWRGWVLSRLEGAFGFIPALLLGSLLYALYHVGYGMPAGEITFLFFIGVMYAVAFKLTGSIFILWPFFQPAGQLVTLAKDGLPLPMIAALGFFEALILMAVLVWLAARYAKKHHLQA